MFKIERFAKTHRLCEAHGEVHGHLEVHPLPVGVQQDAELLHPPQGKHGDQHLAPPLHTRVDFLQEISLPINIKTLSKINI